jgi:hypothetical protein
MKDKVMINFELPAEYVDAVDAFIKQAQAKNKYASMTRTTVVRVAAMEGLGNAFRDAGIKLGVAK